MATKNQSFVEYFRTFHIIFRIFLNIFERFRMFSNVFFLPISPKPTKLTRQSSFLPQKQTSPLKNNLKKPQFPPYFSIFDFHFHLQFLIFLCPLRSKKVFAINPRPCIIGFMVETRTTRTHFTGLLGLLLLLRRKAQ